MHYIDGEPVHYSHIGTGDKIDWDLEYGDWRTKLHIINGKHAFVVPPGQQDTIRTYVQLEW